jgi:hypothetical protein
MFDEGSQSIDWSSTKRDVRSEDMNDRRRRSSIVDTTNDRASNIYRGDIRLWIGSVCRVDESNTGPSVFERTTNCRQSAISSDHSMSPRLHPSVEGESGRLLRVDCRRFSLCRVHNDTKASPTSPLHPSSSRERTDVLDTNIHRNRTPGLTNCTIEYRQDDTRR